MTTRKIPVWSPAELHRHLNEGSRLSILDVRNQDEFDTWKIEGKGPIQTLNIPYFDLLDLEEEDEEIAAAVARAVPDRLKDSLPRSGPILAVCAKGDTSAHVAEGLRRLGYQAFNLEGGMAAWGDHYEMRAVEETPRFTLLQISRPARGCLSYLLASGGEAMVVDAARHIEVYTRIAAERGWRITTVFDTHLQADHLSGGVALAKSMGVDYWLHPYDSIHPDDLLPATFSFRYLEDGTAFTLGEVNVRALHLPGHTLGMTNPLVDDRFLLTADTLFIGSIGRPDLGGRAKTWAPLLYRSLQRVLTLPDHTVVLPAHFSHMQEADDQGCYCATIGALRSRNEGLRMLSQGLEVFTAYILEHLPEHPPSYDDIRRVNTGLLQVDEAKASELELGRNQCALSHGKTG
ncbi:MBL fold metallo-hydrolase [Sulfuricella sp.]|uniref:MBL fold metallo-hydrolase n=1 Tax=Sulfuricella sp. TaxID=2099377 RepID=UPI002C91F683|nr:MBL fold metallo-hydrolase [Sulfuricella sp.]HUX64676.1 MBL fold metallo-hydrolase [Sulfuricella sp.]